MTTQLLAAEIVSIVQHSPDSSLNLAAVVANKLEAFRHEIFEERDLSEYKEDCLQKANAEIARLNQLLSGKVGSNVRWFNHNSGFYGGTLLVSIENNQAICHQSD